MKNNTNESASHGPIIFLGGYYGFHNAGDEAILESILSSIRQRRSDVQFVVASGDPAHTASTYGVQSVSWLDMNEIINQIHNCDLVIIGGGGLFTDYWGDMETLLTKAGRGVSYYSNFAIIADLLGKPFMTYAVGIGPLLTDEGKQITRFALQHAERITVRDIKSAQTAIELLLPKEIIEVTADAGFLLQANVEEGLKALQTCGLPDLEAPILLASCRPWDVDIAEEVWQQEFAGAIDAWLEEYNGYAVFLPFQVLQQPGYIDDIAITERIIHQINRKDRTFILGEPLSPSAMAGVFAKCTMALGMRYHAILFAALTNTPMVAVSYDPKVENLMQSLGMNNQCISLYAADKDNIFSALRSVADKRDSISARLRQQIPALRSEAEINTDIVLQLLASAQQKQIDKNNEFADALLLKQTRLLNDWMDRFDELRSAHERLESSHKQLVSSHKELESSHKQLVSSHKELESSHEQLVSSHKELELSYRELDDLHIKLKDRHSRLQGDYATIINSRTFRVAQRMARISGRIFPVGGRARRFVSSILNVYRVFKKDGIQGVRILLLGQPIVKPPESVLRDQLRDLLKKHKNKTVVIYPPNIDWDIPIFQRPQQMALAYARQGCLVIFCEPRFAPIKGFVNTQSSVYVYQGPLEIFDMIESPVMVGFTYNAFYAKYFKNPRVVYEFIDDLDVFPYDQDNLRKEHLHWCQNAAVVVATARNLQEEVSPLRADVLLNPNAVDYAHYEVTRQKRGQIPEELQKMISAGSPIFGYFGSLARWFDYDLLKDVAALRKDYQFILIGPDYDGTIGQSGILDVPNIHWLGTRPYKNLPNYLAFFNATMIPFIISDITHATSPLKLFEYMAGHKPVVITPMKESMFTPGVLVGKTPREFAERLDEALQLQSSREYVALLDEVARANTWDARVTDILTALREKQSSHIPNNKKR